MPKSIDILSIDAKDLYLSNNYLQENEIGYNIRNKQNEINIKKFINSADNSLEINKLREIYEKIYRNTYFTFSKDNHIYSTKIINVTFKYSVKEFNEIRKNIFVKNGYKFEDIELQDCVCIKNNELIAIEINKKFNNEIDEELLCKQFKIKDGTYKQKNIKTLKSTSDLRYHLYKNGFICDGIKYIRYKRSSGSSRVGKCLFIDEKLYDRIHKWEKCGLKVIEGQDIDLAAWESSISLPLSSIIDTIEILPKNILVIDDYDSIFQENCIETKLKDGWLETKENLCTIKNSIWDGQSIGDKSLFDDKYSDKGMLLLRNRFFKSCVFNGNIQEFFKDNNITSVNQLNGFTLATKIEDIKLITTPNSIKYMKFGKLEDWLNNIEPIFGIVKYEKPPHFFDGEMTQIHYQLLNTLQLSQSEIEEFMKPTFEFLRLLKNDSSVLRWYIKYPDNVEFNPTSLNSKNDIIYKLLGLNERFCETKIFNDFRNDLIRAYIKNIKSGHVLVNGNYSTLCGNPIEMLMAAIGRFNGESQIGIGNIYSKRFEFDKEILGSRSPHVVSSNIWVVNNNYNNIIEKYMNPTNEIVYINNINENTMNRLSGSDEDGDTALLTDNFILLKSAKKNYDKFLVPVDNVKSDKRKRKYTAEEKADLDIKTSNNKIGEVINTSQCLNSIFWDRLNNGEKFENLKQLYYDICQLDIMAGAEIDKAKKEVIIDMIKEMDKIKNKWIKTDELGRSIKPNFFGHINRQKGYYNSKKKNYKRHKTSMDYLQHSINKFCYSIRDRKDNLKPFHYILDKKDYDYNNIYYEQVNRILKLVDDTKKEINKIHSNEMIDNSKKYELSSEIRQECVEYIGNIKLNYSTMYYILSLLDKEEYKNRYKFIFNILFGYPNISFFKVIENSKEVLYKIEEDKYGEIEIFGKKYTKK